MIPAIQALLNCGDAGSCAGGDSLAAFAWVANASNAAGGGVPDVTCQAYEARSDLFNASSHECRSGFAVCRTCVAWRATSRWASVFVHFFLFASSAS